MDLADGLYKLAIICIKVAVYLIGCQNLMGVANGQLCAGKNLVYIYTATADAFFLLQKHI